MTSKKFMSHRVICTRESGSEEMRGLFIVEIDCSEDSLDSVKDFRVRKYHKEESGVEFVDRAIRITTFPDKRIELSFEDLR